MNGEMVLVWSLSIRGEDGELMYQFIQGEIQKRRRGI